MWQIAQITDPTSGAVTWQVRQTAAPDVVVAGGLVHRHEAVARVGELLTAALTAAGPDAPVGPRFEARYEEGEETRDGGYYRRIIDAGASNFDRAMPIPLMATEETSWGHEGAVLVGAITGATRDGATTVVLSGNFGTWDRAIYFAERVDDGMLPRHSPDLGSDETEFICTEYDEDEWGVFCAKGELHFTAATVLGTTIVPFPALDGAVITLPDGLEVTPVTPAPAAVAASAVPDAVTGEGMPGRIVGGFVAAAAATAPVRSVTTLAIDRPAAPYDQRVFANPGLDGPTPITVHPDFTVSGHVATWFDAEGNDNCHISFPDQCITPPRSATDYRYAHQGGPVELTNGERLRVGHLTVGTGHAATSGLSADAAAAHYDNTGYSAALVRYGEDEHGIWCAGVISPGADDFQIWALELATLSGDWRRINGNLELVAALAVNVPGFPITNVVTASAAGECQALVAAGAHTMARLKQARPTPVPGDQLMPMFRAEVAYEKLREDLDRVQSSLARRVATVETIVAALNLEGAAADALHARIAAAIEPSPAPVTRRQVALDRTRALPTR